MADRNSPTAKRRITASVRRAEALKLRLGGATFQEIADVLSIRKQSAHELVCSGLDDLAAETRDSTERLRAQEGARLDRMLSILWPKVEAGDLGAIDRALKVIQTRTRLFGLAPTGPLVSVNVHATPGMPGYQRTAADPAAVEAVRAGLPPLQLVAGKQPGQAS